MRTFIALSLFSIVATLVAVSGCPGTSGGEGEGEGAAAEGEGEGGEGEGEGAAGEGEGEGASQCPVGALDACSGDVVGSWTLHEICPPEGTSLSGPCADTAFGTTAGCEADNDVATCTQVYTSNLVLAADGTGSIQSGVSIDRVEVFSAACASAAGSNADPTAACASFNQPGGGNACAFDGAHCTCHAVVDGGSDTQAVSYTLDGAGFHFHPAASDPIDGPYCVAGDTLTLSNVFGWPFWVFHKN